MTNKIRSYEALASHLCPEDPSEGVRQIDTAILTLQRARHRGNNRRRAASWFALFVLALSTAVLGVQAICWLEPELLEAPLDRLVRRGSGPASQSLASQRLRVPRIFLHCRGCG